MNWEEYKPLAETSRDIIVLPFFSNALKGKSGVWLDIGCGNGDLTRHIAKNAHFQIVGIDKELPEGSQKLCAKNSVHLLEADLTKSGIAETGIIFNGAYSNCCFCHLTDNEFFEVAVDLYNSLEPGAELIFLVPSFEWAHEMYSDIIYVPSGITAIPRYGERQHFRLPAWYESTLIKSGFTDVRSGAILIPSNPKLDSRYLQRFGFPLFTAFYATRAERISENSAIQKAFDVAHDNRKLEIQLFWQRALFFWGFVSAALVGYVGALDKSPPVLIPIALFGFLCSIVWSQGNRGSKYWQEYWEKKVNHLQHYTTGSIFYDRKPSNPGFLNIFEGRRISVSKLTMALSDFSVLLWFILCVAAIFPEKMQLLNREYIYIASFLATLLYCLFFLRNSKSED